MILIETPGGERQLVTSLKGHEDCAVLHSSVPAPPSDFHDLDHATGKWKENTARRDEAREEARLMGMTRREMMAELRAELRAEMKGIGNAG